jgi:hypothetical protein
MKVAAFFFAILDTARRLLIPKWIPDSFSGGD